MANKYYLLEVIVSNEDAPRLLTKHGFIKDKTMWRLNGDEYKFSTKAALQALVLAFVTKGFDGRRIKEKVPIYFKKIKKQDL